MAFESACLSLSEGPPSSIGESIAAERRTGSNIKLLSAESSWAVPTFEKKIRAPNIPRAVEPEALQIDAILVVIEAMQAPRSDEAREQSNLADTNK
jgi:hypothetical protein